MVDYAPVVSPEDEDKDDNKRARQRHIQTIACFVLAGVFALGCVGMIAINANSEEMHLREINAAQGRITDAEARYETLISRPSVTEEVVAQQLNNANEAGSVVAAAQNYYAQVVADETATQSDVSSYVGDITAATTPWLPYVAYPYTWQFCTTYDFSDEKVDCVWLCHIDETGDLVAYANAVYDTNTKIFGDITVVKTGAITQYEQTTTG